MTGVEKLPYTWRSLRNTELSRLFGGFIRILFPG
jgi:hypothetical protein